MEAGHESASGGKLLSESGHRLGHGRRRNRQLSGRLVEGALGVAEGGERAVATDEAHPASALVALLAHDGHAADLGGRTRVGAAAGLEVEALGLHQAYRVARILGCGHAQAKGLGPGDRADPHRPGLPDDLVGAAHGRRDLLVAHGPVEVDRRHLAPEVEARRACRMKLDERTGKQVLAVMLLAVVAAPLAVDAAVDTIGGEGPAQQVDDVASHLQDRDHGDAVEGSRVPGLAAALGVERGLVEDHGRLALDLAALDDGGVELEQVRIVPVEPPRSLAQALITPGGAYPERARSARIPCTDTCLLEMTFKFIFLDTGRTG